MCVAEIEPSPITTDLVDLIKMPPLRSVNLAAKRQEVLALPVLGKREYPFAQYNAPQFSGFDYLGERII